MQSCDVGDGAAVVKCSDREQAWEVEKDEWWITSESLSDL